MRKIRRVEESSEWPIAVGRVVIAFGHVEHLTSALIKTCVKKRAGAKAAKWDLYKRLLCLNRLLRQKGLPRPLTTRWGRAYRAVQTMRRKYRNTLAHGAPGPVIEFNDDEIIHSIRLSTPKSAKERLSIDQVLLVAEDIEGMRVELSQAAMEILTVLVARRVFPLPLPALSVRKKRRPAKRLLQR